MLFLIYMVPVTSLPRVAGCSCKTSGETPVSGVIYGLSHSGMRFFLSHVQNAWILTLSSKSALYAPFQASWATVSLTLGPKITPLASDWCRKKMKSLRLFWLNLYLAKSLSSSNGAATSILLDSGNFFSSGAEKCAGRLSALMLQDWEQFPVHGGTKAATVAL